jgi:hypothetical protein
MFVLPLLCENEALIGRRAATGSSLGLCRETSCSAGLLWEYDVHPLVHAAHPYTAPIQIGRISCRHWTNQPLKFTSGDVLASGGTPRWSGAKTERINPPHRIVVGVRKRVNCNSHTYRIRCGKSSEFWSVPSRCIKTNGTTYAYEKGQPQRTLLLWNERTRTFTYQGPRAWSVGDDRVVSLVGEQ